MNIVRSRVQRFTIVATLSLLGFGHGARAGIIFNFDSIAAGTGTPFADTQGGLTATFSSPADPNGFSVEPTVFTVPFAGNDLEDSGKAPDANIPLTAGFNAPLTSVGLDFATRDPGAEPSQFVLQAFSGGVGGTPVGGSTALGSQSTPNGFIGSITFNSAIPFDTLRFSTNGPAPAFAVDNLNVTLSSVAAVPEPNTCAMMALGLALLVLAGWRKRLAQVVPHSL